jgi:hypothetical protein
MLEGKNPTGNLKTWGNSQPTKPLNAKLGLQNIWRKTSDGITCHDVCVF